MALACRGGAGRDVLRRRLFAVCLVAVAVALVVRQATSGDGSAGAGAGAGRRGLHVSGNRLLDRHGRPVQFHGVNRAGTEYSCIHGEGIFDGPSDAASVGAIASWRVNVIRIPLNEDCWLGINGAASRYSGSAYRNAIVNYVRLLHRHRLYAELSLMWAAPGAYRATYQSGAPDADHSPAVWASMARMFKDDTNVILAPWGETVVDAGCFLRGGVCEATFGLSNTPYRVAGMQQAVDVMRRTGYKGVIAIPGVQYANDLSRWLSYEPKDPLHQLIAEAHVYGKNACATTACFDSTLAPVARRAPVILGETGESYDGSDCGTSSVSTIVNWAEVHGVGYEAWTWDTWGNCSALIDDYAGQPHAAYGAWIKARFASSPVRLLGAS